MTVAIVGAGITGLALTHFLRERGVSMRLFEQSSTPGGVIRSRSLDGLVVEDGPQRLRRTPEVNELITTTGLESTVIEGKSATPLLIYHDGVLERAPRSIKAFLKTDLLSWRGKLRVLMEPFVGRSPRGGSVEDYFTHRLGTEAYERFVGPLFGGLYGSDPATMPAKYALEPLFSSISPAGSLLGSALRRSQSSERPPPATFCDGMQQLPKALYRRHNNVIDLETPVSNIERIDTGWQCEFAGGSMVADSVVVTASAPHATSILPPAIGSPLEQLTYNPLAIVHLSADTLPAAFGYQVSFDATDLRTLGVSFPGHLFGRESLASVYLGGATDPDIFECSDQRIGEIATTEFREATGQEATVLDVVRLDQAIPAWDSSWEALDEVTLPAGLYLPTNYRGRLGIPARIREARSLAETLD